MGERLRSTLTFGSFTSEGRVTMSRILSLALCYIAAASDPVLDDAIPRDLPLRQLRGEMRSTAASQESPANDPTDKNDDENEDGNSGENHDEHVDENDDENDDQNDDENDSNVATGIAGDDPDLDAEAVENACVNQTGW